MWCGFVVEPRAHIKLTSMARFAMMAPTRTMCTWMWMVLGVAVSQLVPGAVGFGAGTACATSCYCCVTWSPGTPMSCSKSSGKCSCDGYVMTRHCCLSAALRQSIEKRNIYSRVMVPGCLALLLGCAHISRARARWLCCAVPLAVCV